jgi:hypothetical protein
MRSDAEMQAITNSFKRYLKASHGALKSVAMSPERKTKPAYRQNLSDSEESLEREREDT